MVNQQLLDYVLAQKTAGVSADDVSKNLLGVGWQRADIDEALRTTGMISTPAVPVPPPAAPEAFAPAATATPAEEKPAAPQSASVYGDGSLVNVFDLGLPAKNPVYEPEQAHKEETAKPESSEVKPMTSPSPVPGMVEQWAKPVEPQQPAPVIQPAPAVAEVKHPAKGLNKLTILGIVFIVLGLLIGGVWWFVSQNQSPAPTVVPQAMNPVATPEPTKAVQVLKSGLLADEQFVSDKGFKMLPPKDWRIDESGSFGTLATFSNLTIDEDKGNKFAANINVVTEEAKGTTLDEYLKLSKEMLQKTFTSYKVESETKVKIGTYDAVLLEATYEMGVFSLHNIQLMVLVKDSAYVVTGTSLATTWETYKELISASLMTFAI
jgi:hypothetical protein